MKLNLVYFSPTGGTKSVAGFVAAAWDMEKTEIDLSALENTYPKHSFDKEDLCIIAVPSFGGRVPAIALEHIKDLKGGGAMAILIAVYGNRDYDDTLLELKNVAKSCGFVPIAAIGAVAEHSIMREFATGRPDEEDAAELKKFGEQIKAGIEEGLPAEAAEIAVPGNENYCKYDGLPLKPKADKTCTACGKCAEACPTGAIPRDNPSATENALCITCMRCVSLCPVQARSLNKIMLFAATKAMKKSCSGRKINELFQ